jgi:hypothetical protein
MSILSKENVSYSIYTKSQTSIPYFLANQALISNTNKESQAGL